MFSAYTLIEENTGAKTMSAEQTLSQEKIGIDGLLHKTDVFGEFEPIADNADIYGDNSMVTLADLHEPDNKPACKDCAWFKDCNSSTEWCEAFEVGT